MKETLEAYLRADETFMGFLTGGLYNSWEHNEIALDNHRTKDAFSNKKLLPSALIKFEDDSPTLALTREDGRVYRFIFSLMFYTDQGNSSDPIYDALARAYVLLEGWMPAGVWRTEHAGDLLDQGEEILRAKMLLSRYVILYRRS